MSVVIQQTTQMIMDHCHLRLEQRRYTVAANRFGFK